ncbi:MAG: hypothetical protein IPG09_15300 [Ignavibacteria bacterium]|nr:hypothetical protein [Ignavibacteria bacterium]
MKIKLYRRSVKSIKNTVHELRNGIITGFLLVCLILLASMGLKTLSS